MKRKSITANYISLLVIGTFIACLCLFACSTAPKGMPVYKALTTQEYTTLTNSDKPVLVDFSAAWCNPCKMLAPVLDDLNNDKDINSKLTIVRLDSKVHENIFNDQNIEAYPTLILYRKGAIIWREEGFQQKETLKEKLLSSF